MTVSEFIDKLKYAASIKTLYIKGCFGAPMTSANKKRYTNNLVYNKLRSNMINSCSSDTFGFDCVCLIKGILWGWTGDRTKNYGGATYCSNGVPDVGADGILKYCKDVSTNFANIQPGEIVWMSGHVGVYIGEGKVIECSPKWTNNVQYSNLGNLGYKTGNYRIWKKHGVLPWVTLDSRPNDTQCYYTVIKGDTLTKIAIRYDTTVKDILALNSNIKNPNFIRVGQIIRVK